MKFVFGVMFGAILTVAVDVGAQQERTGWFYSAKELLGMSDPQQTAYAIGAYDMLSFAIETHNSAPNRDWWPILIQKSRCLQTSATTAGALRAKGKYLYTRGVDEGKGEESAASILLSDACR